MKCPIPKCGGELKISSEMVKRAGSGFDEIKYGESTSTTRVCSKCGLILEFHKYQRVKGKKGDWTT